ncbi:MAG: hypothetical protein GY705_30255 [Bacteroidetes bacterium]|nr:hypothetical protein [Bacteroidota bacterium]
MGRKLIKLYFLVIALSCFYVQSSNAKQAIDTLDSQIGGLKFLSKQVFASERTSLSLFPKFKKFDSGFTLSFDYNIYNTNRFGYVFRIVDSREETGETYLHLIYNPVPLSDTYNLELVSPITHSEINISLPVKEQKKLRFSIHYDALRQEIIMSCNGVTKSLEGVNLNEGLYNIIFGLWGQNTDVAAMNLRNIRLLENDETQYFWPLNEYDGTRAIDRVKGVVAEIKNPVWLRNEHFYWKKLRSFEADEMVGVIYKERDQNIYFVNKDSLVIFSPSSDTLQVHNYSNERPFTPNYHFSIYNNATDQIISYDFRFLLAPDGKRPYSILNENTLEWSPIDAANDNIANHHHCIFWNLDSNKVTTFGGYANFEYFNVFRTYDFSTDSWRNQEMTGDTIFPRTHAVIGNDANSGLFYVYGGFGNEKGQQAFGGRIFYDLYAVDIENNKVAKLFDYPNNDYDFIPRGQLIVDNGGKDFYTLGSKMVDQSFLQLFHINPEEGSIHSISDSIPVLFTNMAGNVFLFKNDIVQELYCVSRENTSSGNSLISIYRLKYPPSNLFGEKVQGQSNNKGLVTALILITFLLIGFITGFYFKRKKSVSKRKVEEKTPVEYFRKEKNAMWFLGEFKVFDIEGKDISYRFSKKLKELFLLVFFETIHYQGISSRKLSETLWPGMDKYHQKNNRGVTINNLRKTLEDLHGVALINSHNKWKIEYSDDFYSDFLEVNKSIKANNFSETPDSLISLISFGSLLPQLQFDWLDQYKSRYESDILVVLYHICNNYYAERQYLSCLETARIIHEKFDPIDEIALSFKIKALNKIKSQKKAYDEFELFKKKYTATYNDNYVRTFNEVENLQYDFGR